MNRSLGFAAACFCHLMLFVTFSYFQTVPLKTIEFETSQVTSPDIALTPDGQHLIFTMLGKLFRMSVKGGTAEQLSFGPHYDANPAISPDGKLVAFDSDRDGSAGNIFLLDLSSKEIRQITREDWADRPVWAPDGKSIVYLNLIRKDWLPREVMVRPPAEIKRIRPDDGTSEILRPKANTWFATYLKDGRLAWSIVDGAAAGITSRIETESKDGKAEAWRSFDHGVDRMIPNAKPDGLVVRKFTPDGAIGEIAFVPQSGPERRIVPVSSNFTSFALTSDAKELYTENKGHIWKVAFGNGRMEPVPFQAKISLQIRPHARPAGWKPVQPGESRAPRTLRSPRMFPDGSAILFEALGEFWIQQLNAASPRQLTRDQESKSEPVISPDGKQVGFIRRADGKREIRILDLTSGTSRTVAPPTECGYEQLSWGLSGQLIAATACDHDILSIDPRNPSIKVLVPKASDWETSPFLSADGNTLYFQAEFPDTKPQHYKLSLGPDAKPQLLRPATMDGGNMSVVEGWRAEPFENQIGIRISKVSESTEQVALLVKEADGQEFSLSPDGRELVYVEGNRLYRQPTSGGERKQVLVDLRFSAPSPPDMLVRNVRILDMDKGTFGLPTSMLLANGRIQRIGESLTAPKGATVLDAAGKFAIPGLFDMHGHAATCGGQAHIAAGVTSVRNMGGRLESQNDHADRADFTEAPLPRCFYSGRILEGAQGRREDFYFVHPASPEDARMYVRRAKEQGADFIKLYERLPWPIQRAASDEGHKLGLPIEAHSGSVERSVKALSLGYAGLTHVLPFYEDMQMMMLRSGAHWDPTLGVTTGREMKYREDPERFKAWPYPLPKVGDLVLQGRWNQRLRSVRSAHRLGIPIVPGTDTGPNAGGIPLHWELEFFEEAGISPIDIIRAATIVSARTLGADAQLGKIEKGMLADILLLDADPLVDIRNAQKVWRVFKNGWIFDPKTTTPKNP